MKSLYFIAVIVPDPYAKEIRSFQEFIAQEVSSKAALRSPPHITVVPPFAADDGSADRIAEVLDQLSLNENIDPIALNGFGAFGNRVIYVRVEDHAGLHDIAGQAPMVLRNQGYKVKEERRQFHPHVTIGFKDLSPAGFDVAMGHFKEVSFQCEFPLQELAVLRHVKKRWKVVREIRLG